MKPRGYRVAVSNELVRVEHRASIRPRTVVLLLTLYAMYCFLPPVRSSLRDTLRTHDPVSACFLLFFLLLPWICGATWLFFASGEVLLCDRREAQLATRKSWGKWRRRCLPIASVRSVRSVRWIIYGGPKRRTYPVLEWQAEDAVYRVLEDIDYSQAEPILLGLRALGYPAQLHEADAMLKDIDKRGWWVNPLKPDPPPSDES